MTYMIERQQRGSGPAALQTVEFLQALQADFDALLGMPHGVFWCRFRGCGDRGKACLAIKIVKIVKFAEAVKFVKLSICSPTFSQSLLQGPYTLKLQCHLPARSRSAGSGSGSCATTASALSACIAFHLTLRCVCVCVSNSGRSLSCIEVNLCK